MNKPVAWLATNAVGHRYLRFKKPDETHKPVPLYALEDEPPCKTGSQCVGGKCERCAVQEPWGYISHRSWKMPVFVEADDLEVSGLPFNNPDYTPVYKAPPQRDEAPAKAVEWQGLTDEETSDLIWKSDYEPRKIARAIEAKLREKNL